jgi:hypothetical protein
MPQRAPHRAFYYLTNTPWPFYFSNPFVFDMDRKVVCVPLPHRTKLDAPGYPSHSSGL